MTYATYEFYAKVYAGDMSEKEFIKWSGRATEYIDMMTHGRAATAPESMQQGLAMAFCMIIDSLANEAHETAETQNGTIKSANNDGLSVSYATASIARYSNQRQQALHTWLTYPVNLMSGWI